MLFDLSTPIAFLPWPKEVVNIMPFLSGKVVLAVLILLSAISWGIILSKHFKLRLVIEADKQFGSRLRKTARCLELYEHSLAYPESPLYQIYLAGAKSTALEMVGDQRPEFLAKTQLVTANTLSSDQMTAISAAFDDGFRKGLELMKGGFRSLRYIALTAVGLGVVSSIHYMIKSLNEFGSDVVTMLIASVVMIVASFSVALPAEWYRLRIRRLYQKRVDKMIRFHYGINKTFTNQLQKLVPASKAPVPTESKPDPVLKLPQIEKQKPRYFSLSQTLLAEDEKPT